MPSVAGDKLVFSYSFLCHKILHRSTAGDTFLQNLQDKVRVSDVYQETLHKEISVLEEVLQQSKAQSCSRDSHSTLGFANLHLQEVLVAADTHPHGTRGH